MKMYIAIKNTTPVGHAMNCAAHAAVACVQEYSNYAAMQIWLRASFKKVTCKVNEETFNKLKEIDHHKVVISESALGGREIAIAFVPLLDGEEYHELLRSMKLWR